MTNETDPRDIVPPIDELLATMETLRKRWSPNVDVAYVENGLRAYVEHRKTAGQALYDCHLTLESIRPYTSRVTSATQSVLRAWVAQRQAKAVAS